MTVTLAGWLEQHAELPRLDREILLCHHLSLDRTAVLVHPERQVTPDKLKILESDSKRLRAGEPLAYILGEWSFWDFDLTITPAVLVPRPETETLVEAALAHAEPGNRVLDLGTGSGAIAIALSRAADLSVLAVDASAPALDIAGQNAIGAEASVDFLQSDWFTAVEGQFDIIVSNPPYVAAQDPHLAALGHEPRSALVSGPEGLDDLTSIITQASSFLITDGWLLVEHGYDQAEAVAGLFNQSGFLNVSLIRDLGGQPRVTVGRRPETVGRRPETVGRRPEHGR